MPWPRKHGALQTYKCIKSFDFDTARRSRSDARGLKEDRDAVDAGIVGGAAWNADAMAAARGLSDGWEDVVWGITDCAAEGGGAALAAPSLPPLLRRYTRNGSTVLAPPTDADPLPATTSRAAVEAGEVGGDTYTLGFGRFGRGGSVKGTGSDVEGGTAVRPAAADA